MNQQTTRSANSCIICLQAVAVLAASHTDLCGSISCILVALFAQLVSRQQACDHLLPLMRVYITRQLHEPHAAPACAAVLQPEVVIAAQRALGLKKFMMLLHGSIMELVLSRPDNVGTEMAVNGMQVSYMVSMGGQECA